MPKLVFSPLVKLNSRDLGLQVSADAVTAPLELRAPLERMGVKSAETLVSSLQSFPTAIAAPTGLDSQALATAVAGALELLRPHVDARMFAETTPERRGLGAMPPRRV
jgi:hypothetical protein